MFPLQDSYNLLYEAFIHAGASTRYRSETEIFHGDLTEENLAENFKGIDGMLIAQVLG